MLFIMAEKHGITMWMKDTLIPLDMLFIDAKGRIVRIAANARPESTPYLGGTAGARRLELAGGAAEDSASPLATGLSPLFQAMRFFCVTLALLTFPMAAQADTSIPLYTAAPISSLHHRTCRRNCPGRKIDPALISMSRCATG